MGITFEITLEVSVKEGARDTVDQATSRVHGVPNPEEVAIHGTMDGTDPIPITPSPA
ncbi:hypothetical protein CFP59_06062 [Streptomyces malaysiensis subsp. malaysiensis]|nr:hypothetical protein CFP59_06062 [Streptomyces sp. M56]SCG11899.1 hypothetical protein GA0115260_115743 [Streptomyces sp. MnatMP-M27]